MSLFIFAFNMKYEKITISTFSLIALLICSLSQDVSAKPPQKVLQGTDASIKDFPSIVSIIYNDLHRCGGVLISNKHILTATHCFIRGLNNNSTTPTETIAAEAILVLAGKDELPNDFLDVYEAEKIYLHEDFNADQKLHDIAIITLKNAIVPSDKQKPISLPSRDTQDGDIGEIVGWGRINKKRHRTNKLKHTKMTAITYDSLCKESHICAYQGRGIGACSGDSGGPFIVNNEVVGIMSWANGCGSGQPEMYTRVYYYKDWINKIIKS